LNGYILSSTLENKNQKFLSAALFSIKPDSLECGDTAVRFGPSLIVIKQAANKALEIFEGLVKSIKK
jgi:4-aminobutyrate aminotransferase-like enzyme|tara:strand:- start:109 stop:309 length:201 start_codon:yes stop_codon:yes gene_type:complete